MTTGGGQPAITRTWRRETLLVAGLLYPVAWVLGLCVFTASTDVTSSGRELLHEYRGHASVLVLQFLLTEGFAAVLLGLVIVAAAAQIVGRPRRIVQTAGLAAVAISLLQCVMGVVMASIDVPAQNAGATALLSGEVNRLDGVKMALLAVTFSCMAAAVGNECWRGRRNRAMFPRLLLSSGFGLTAVALSASAVGYLALNGTWANAAFVSLPLLILSVISSAVLVYRAGEP